MRPLILSVAMVICLTPADAAGLCEPCSNSEECTEEGAECLPTDDGDRCGRACSGTEPCPPGYNCQDLYFPEWQCVPDTNSCTCDGSNPGLVRDCEVSSPDGTYTCTGIQECEVWGWDQCILPIEICNGLDDNCDGDFDEGYGDWDGDHFGESCECAPNDANTYPNAPEVNDGQDNQCSGDNGYGLVDEMTSDCGFHNAINRNEYSCTPLQALAIDYEQLRWTQPNLTGDCDTRITIDTVWIDLDLLVNSGDTFFYLTRPRSPHIGSWGEDSSGVERFSTCP